MKSIDSPVIAVDFDGTLALTSGRFPEIISEIPGAVEGVKKLHKEGFWLIIWSCRGTEEQLNIMKGWLKEKNILDCFDAINENLPHYIEKEGWESRKIFANYYIDDRVAFFNVQNFWEDIDNFILKVKRSK